MKLQFKNKNSGFTLIEVIIATVIIGIVAVVISELYLKGTISSKTEMNRAKLQIEAKNVVEGITSNIKLSTKMESSYEGYTGNATTLILSLPAVKPDESFIYSGNQKVHDYIVYYLENKNLHKLVFSTDANSRLYSQNASDKILLTNVKTLNFTYEPTLPTSIIVTTDITVENITQKVAQEVSVNAKSKRRNSD